jgi:dTDP-4-dehydrorhamnose 3,5-epimerase
LDGAAKLAKDFMRSNLPEVLILEHDNVIDSRGGFQKVQSGNISSVFQDLKFIESGFATNRSRGTIRGLHFKKAPSNEWKMVTCVNGAIFDVTVDVRLDSKNYGKVYAHELNLMKGISLIIPPGFAHGYQTLTDEANVFYQFTEIYKSLTTMRLKYDDANLGITWPIAVTQISIDDKEAPPWPVKY